MTGWLKSIGSQILYELDHTKPVLYVIPIDDILGKLLVVPVGDTWNNSIPPQELLSRRSRRQQAGWRRWMQDLVCKLVGDGVVPWYVMNGKGSSASIRQLTLLWVAGFNKYTSCKLWLLCLLGHLLQMQSAPRVKICTIILDPQNGSDSEFLEWSLA